MTQAVAIQINQAKDTAGVETSGNIFRDIKTFLKKIFQHKADPDKIKAPQIIKGLADVGSKILDAFIVVMGFGILDPLPGEIDAAVDQLQQRYALTLPLADLISSDVFEMIDKRALAWGYIGVHDVEGTLAHHIAILGERADLQLWIQKDGQPLPLKLVVTYKSTPSAPQYEAVLMDWELDAKVAASTFEPDLPDGAQKIEFLVAEGGR